MLRFALLVLLVANAGYLAWSQGWMATLGWTPEAQSEPYRLKQQVRPDVLSVVPTQSANRAPPASTASSVAASEPEEEILPETTVCLQSENMDEAQSKKLQQVLQQSDLPAASWAMQSSVVSGRWMVYLGKFPNEAALDKRRTELRTRKIGYDRAGGTLEPGLSLGRFSSEDAATRELGQMLNQGVRGARVVQERAPQTLYALQLSHATAAQRSILQRLQPAMGGKVLRTCPP